ncbi:MAG: hypothetical protein CVV44_15605 [Spirochaetae bacterium HGW-Spirochaetae-1]|jgi:formylglycine-generating enzyme required for sulfatase activity|nr:MAG: hypothetical protein CVV44_15605 [Spirochaetae bacterium HGW-Spirochaetae-1]
MLNVKWIGSTGTVFVLMLALLSCGKNDLYDAGKISLETVVAAGGSFTEGYTGVEDILRTVTLTKNLHVGKYEITYYQWMTIKNWAGDHDYGFYSSGYQGSDSDHANDDHPVTYITWRDCIAWCNALSENEGLTPCYYTSALQDKIFRDASIYAYDEDDDYYEEEEDYDRDISNDCVNWNADGYRLLTGAEWEYAARNGGTSQGDEFSGYVDGSQALGDYCWYSGNSGGYTHEVGKKNQNSLGLYDMTGNVMEWCWDWKEDWTTESVTDPQGPDTGSSRSIRGGAFYHLPFDASVTYSDLLKSLLTSYRECAGPAYGEDGLGFRICRISE